MVTVEFSLNIASKGFGDVVDITDKIESFLVSQNLNNGIIYIYNASNNVGIKNIEIKEFKQKMTDENYAKFLMTGNNNMLILPLIAKKLYKDEMTRILFVDFEKSANLRKIIVICVA